MELVRLRDEGVAGVWSFKQSEYEVAWNERQRVLDTERQAGRPVPALELKLNPMPLWQRVTGLGNENEWRLRPSGDPFADIERECRAASKFATRTEYWNPVSEICFYLEIAQTKLSGLLKQTTGLRATDLSDCVRVKGLRAHLKEKMRKSASTWMQNEFGTTDNRGLAKLPAEEGRTIVLREYRASDAFLDRTELAKEFGVVTRARLYRAVRVCEHMELDALERAVALEVFLELLTTIRPGCEISVEEQAALAQRTEGEVKDLRRTKDELRT